MGGGMVLPACPVLAMHGIARDATPHMMSFMNMLDAAAFERLLASSPPFVSLERALTGHGVALTIDDAIRGAADAALLARRLGHQVTLFVNPGQVESGVPYAWLTLAAMLDKVRGRTMSFDGTPHPIRTLAERHRLRREIRRRLCDMKSEPERQALVRALGREWKVTDIEFHPHTTMLTRHDLVALRDAGVDIQNHGFWHHEHRSLTGAESAANLHDGRRWLEREIGVDARYFAAPFGEALPPADESIACDAWFTLTTELPSGWNTRPVFNRETLDIPNMPRAFPRRLTAIRRWVSRLVGAWRPETAPPASTRSG